MENGYGLGIIGNTAISLFVDTCIVITFMSMFGALQIDRMWILIINSYLFKLFFTICSTTILYGSWSNTRDN